jgi:hypothetical protein
MVIPASRAASFRLFSCRPSCRPFWERYSIVERGARFEVEVAAHRPVWAAGASAWIQELRVAAARRERARVSVRAWPSARALEACCG